MNDLASRRKERLGFIGLGDMGAAMAHRFIDSGFPMTLWARRPESLESFVDLPVSIASTPKDVGAASDVVGICVVDDLGTREVVLGPDGVLGGMSPGGIILIHATIHPETCQEIAEVARPLGVTVLDAPVSGGSSVALAGQLAIMVGGTPEDFDRAAGVLEAVGDPVVHLGPLGSGQLAKLVNNTLHVANLGLSNVALEDGVALGLDRAGLARVMSRGSGGSFGLAALGRINSLDGWHRWSGKLLKKDVGILADVAKKDDIDLGLLIEIAEQTIEDMKLS
jgi:3-hydroxyisobutyrate dehydrogenase-like beta-hydroxyacid dehydrogenase